MQVVSTCWLRPNAQQPPVALLAHSAGVTAVLTAPTATKAWQWTCNAATLSAATPLFGTDDGPSLALSFAASPAQPEEAAKVALLNVPRKEIYHELAFHEAVSQVVRFAASGVYSMAAAAAAGAAAAAPTIDAVRKAATSVLAPSKKPAGADASSHSTVTARGYAADSSPGATRDAQRLHSRAAAPAPVQPQDGAMGSMLLLSAPEGVPLAHWQAHPRAVATCAFSPSGRLLATTDETGQVIKVWALPECILSGEAGGADWLPLALDLLYELDRGITHAVVSSIEFAEDESCVFASSVRGTVHIFCIDPLNGGCPKPPVRVTSLAGNEGHRRRHPAEPIAEEFVRVVVPSYVLALPDNPMVCDGVQPVTVTSASGRVYLTEGLQPPPAHPKQPPAGHVRRSSADSVSSIASLNDARRAAMSPPAPPSLPPSAAFLSACVVSHGAQVQHDDGSSPWQLLLEVWTAALDHASKLRGGVESERGGVEGSEAPQPPSTRTRGPSGDDLPSCSTLQKARLVGQHTLLTVLGGGSTLGDSTPYALCSAHRVTTCLSLSRFAATALQQQVSGAFLTPAQATPMLAGSASDSALGVPDLKGVGTAAAGGGKGGYGYQPMPTEDSSSEAKPDSESHGTEQATPQWGVHAASKGLALVPADAYPDVAAGGSDETSGGAVVLGVLPLPSLQRGVKGATHTATAVAAAMANTVQWASDAGSGSVAALSAAWGSAAGALRGAMATPPPIPDTSHMSPPLTATSSMLPSTAGTPVSSSSSTMGHPRTRTASFLGATVGATWLAGDMARELRIRQGRWQAEDVHVVVASSRRGAWWVHPWAPQVRDAVVRSALPSSGKGCEGGRSPSPGGITSSGWCWWGGNDWDQGGFGDVSCDAFFSQQPTAQAVTARLRQAPPAYFDPHTHSAILPGRSSAGGDPFATPPAPGSSAGVATGVPAAVAWGAGGLVLSRVTFPLSGECRQLTPLSISAGVLPALGSEALPSDRSVNLAELWTSGIGADPAAVIALTRPSAPPAVLPQPKDLRKSGTHMARGTWAHVAGSAGSSSSGSEKASPERQALYPAVPGLSFSEDHFTSEGDALQEVQGTPPPSMALLAARLASAAAESGAAHRQ